MKKNLLLVFLSALFPSVLCAQVGNTNMDPTYTTTTELPNGEIPEDSVWVNTDEIDPAPYQWKLDDRFGTVRPSEIDTTFLNFPNTNHNEGPTGHYNHLGNLGSPRLSRIWNERTTFSQLYWLDPYSFFYTGPADFPFTNSKLPYTNISYFFAGSGSHSEKRFKAYFSRNAGKEFAVGFKVDYLYALGYYQNQSNSQFNGSLFASYLGDRYEAKVLYGYYYLKMSENGGITDDRYITDPEAMAQGTRQFDAAEMPVLFDDGGASAWNRNRLHDIFFTHSYNIGFNHTEETITPRDTIHTASADSIVQDTMRIEEYIPVTSFTHTMRIQTNKHTFQSNNDRSANLTSFSYPNTYLRSDNMSADSTNFFSIRNTFSISLLEGFNKYAKAGLRAFIEHEFRNVSLMPRDSTGTGMDTYKENEVYVGGELSKRQGHFLHYDVIGSVGLLGEAIGQFDVRGNLDLNFRLWKDTVSFIARGKVSNQLPAFYLRHYHSNHYRWDNDNMKKEFRTRVEGEINIKRWRTRLLFGMENIQNYTYLNGDAVPEQASSGIQVLNAMLRQDFKLGILHLDNEVNWQQSTGSELPLPTLSLYHNLYIDAYLAKRVLRLQLGVDVRYFTKYKAPAYTPAIGQFHLQSPDDQVDIGGYPILTAYINFHLKQTRFFVQMYHLNQSTGNYFLTPHYPINPSILKFGLSWNFFD